jgi:hypothetical protein
MWQKAFSILRFTAPQIPFFFPLKDEFLNIFLRVARLVLGVAPFAFAETNIVACDA